MNGLGMTLNLRDGDEQKDDWIARRSSGFYTLISSLSLEKK